MNIDSITDSLQQPEYYQFKYFEGAFYPTWNKESALYDWNKIFQHESPIQYKDQLVATNKIIRIDVSDTWPDLGFIEQYEFKNSGYSIPFFHFLNQRAVNITVFEGQYDEIMSEIDLNKGTISIINDIGLAINLLFDQLHRELNQIQLLNSEISNVVKVLFHESLLIVKSEAQISNDSQYNLFPELRHFIRDFIYGGAYSDVIIPDWINIVSNKIDTLPEDLRNTISKFLIHNIEKREPHLCTSEMLARKILILENAKKDLLIGKEAELDSYIISQYPDPAKVVNDFKKQSLNSTHSISDIRNVMITTRNYITDHKAETLTGKVSEIIRIAKTEYELGIDNDVIRKWINFYGEEALPSYKKSRDEKKIS